MNLSSFVLASIAEELRKGRDVVLLDVPQEGVDRIGDIYSKNRVVPAAEISITPDGQDITAKKYSVRIYAREARPEGGHLA
ncbi:hypothetical protein FJZ17_01755 [Candidatus Pacearchaeota archaeon]|nr:hypothetical protein [Candidatus Pacearchaeota archaeon]